MPHGVNKDRGIVRRVRSSELELVSALIRNTLLVSNSLDYDMRIIWNLSRQYSAENLRDMAIRRRMYVHVTGNVIDGTVSLKGDTIYAFFVAPDKQGSGIGSDLLSCMEEVAKSLEIPCLKVDASITAKKFYEVHGYETVREEWDGNYGTVITMKKEL